MRRRPLIARPAGRLLLPPFRQSDPYALWPMSRLALPFGFAHTRSGTAQGLFGDDYASAVYSSYATDTPRFERLSDGRVGLLIEGARTNLLLRSAELNNASWVKAGSPAATITADAIAAPNGVTEADLVNQGSGGGYPYQQVTGALSATYTLSFFAKPHTNTTKIVIGVGGGGAGGADRYIRFNATTGAYDSASGAGTIASYGSTAIGSGWFRYWVTFTTSGADNVFDCIIQAATDANSLVNCAFYVWGAQLEAAAFPSSPIPTAGSTVTRNAETCSFDLGSGGYSGDWTVLLDFVRPTNIEATTSRYLFTTHEDGTFRGAVDCSFGSAIFNIVHYPTVSGSLGSGAVTTQSGRNRVVIVKTSSTIFYSINGNSAVQLTDAAVMTPRYLRLGHAWNGDRQLFGNIGAFGFQRAAVSTGAAAAMSVVT